MQIIIVQAEIETAIRNHILSQIKVADGMEMTIELSATRGAEGFKATIDISPVPVSAGAAAASTPSVLTQTATGVNMAAESQRVVPPRNEAEAEQVTAHVSSIFSGNGAGRNPRTPQEVREMMASSGGEPDTAAPAEAPTETVASREEAASPSTVEAAAPTENAEEAPAPAPAAEGERSQAKSLFRGLRKPVNS